MSRRRRREGHGTSSGGGGGGGGGPTPDLLLVQPGTDLWLDKPAVSGGEGLLVGVGTGETIDGAFLVGAAGTDVLLVGSSGDVLLFS